MSDESTTDDGLEGEFADVLDVLRRFEPTPAAAGFEARIEEQVAMTLEQVKTIEPSSAALDARAVVGISLRCTYCHAGLARDEASFCAACLAPHHDECFVEHGRCTAPGCAETRIVRPREGRQRGTSRTNRPTRRWSRLLLVTAGLTGVLGVVTTRAYFASAVIQVDDEKQMFEMFKRLKAEGLRAFGEFNRAERVGDVRLARAKHVEAHEKLVLAMELLTKIIDKHRDPSTGFTHKDYEGYELDQSEVAEVLVDLEKREKRAPTQNPRNVEAARQLELSRIAANEGRVVESTRLLRLAVELDPANAEARDLLAKVGGIADAVERSSENLARDPQALAIEARLLLREGRLDEALSRAARALELDPAVALAYLVRAEVLVAHGRIAEAMNDLYRAIELDPTHSGAFRLRGRVFQARGELRRAVEDLVHAGELSWGKPEALDDFSLALELDASSDRALFGRARTLRQRGELAAALADLDRAIALNPGQLEYFVERGKVREASGDPAGAAADAEHAAEMRRALRLERER